MTTHEGFILGVRLNALTDEIFKAIKAEPLLIYVFAGESHYISWNKILPVGQKPGNFQKWLVAAPWTELGEALARICAAISQEPPVNFGNLEIYIKYPYTSHNYKKIREFIPDETKKD